MSNGLTEIKLPEYIAKQFEQYTKLLDLDNNPYQEGRTYPVELVKQVGAKLFDLLIYQKEDPEVAKLLDVIKRKANGEKIAAVKITGGPKDPEHLIIDAPYHDQEFDYRNNPTSRGKHSKVAEWFELSVGALFGYVPNLDPHDYNGYKAFQTISPKEGKEATSSGQGANVDFRMHTENSYGNPFSTKEDTLKYLKSDLGLDLEAITKARGITVEKLIDGMITCSNKEIDGLILTAVKNKNTPTRIITAEDFGEALKKEFSADEIKKISEINAAFITGATQIAHVGTIGFIGKMIKLDEAGKVTDMMFNFADGRMDYFGTNPNEKELFERFHAFVKKADIGKDILLQPGQYIFLDNSGTCHARDPLAQEDFTIPLQKGDLLDIRRLVREQLRNAGAGFVKMVASSSKTGKDAFQKL